MLNRPKISIVGAGSVGGTLSQLLIRQGLGDVILLDIDAGLPLGKALDINQAGPIQGLTHQARGTTDYKDTAGSDIVVIVAGIPRSKGMASRELLLASNASIVKAAAEQIVKHSPDCIILVVSNPVDVLSYLAYKASGLPSSRVIGVAGLLDAARFSYFLSLELQISPESICSPVIGVHGEQMVPVLSRANVQGIPISELLTPDQVRKAVERTIKAGAEITNLLQTGSAFYAPASAIAEMVRAIIYDTKKIIPCSVLLSGEYGINGIYIGAPAKIGISGVEQILELDLTEDENKLLNEGAVYIKSLLANLKL